MTQIEGEQRISRRKVRSLVRGLSVEAEGLPIDEICEIGFKQFLEKADIEPGIKGMIMLKMTRTEGLGYVKGLIDGMKLGLGMRLPNQEIIEAHASTGNRIVDFRNQERTK